MLKKLLLLTAFFMVAGCAVKYRPEMVQHIKGSVFKATETGYYTAELVMKPMHPTVGTNRAHLIIHNYEGEDIPGLRIYVTPYLPSKDIEPEVKPTVKDAGRGLYIIENINLTEAGVWELRLKIYGEEMSDSVVLTLPECRGMPMMERRHEGGMMR